MEVWFILSVYVVILMYIQIAIVTVDVLALHIVVIVCSMLLQIAWSQTLCKQNEVQQKVLVVQTLMKFRLVIQICIFELIIYQRCTKTYNKWKLNYYSQIGISSEKPKTNYFLSRLNSRYAYSLLQRIFLNLEEIKHKRVFRTI